ncbi:hypothetical protein V1634_31245 [Plantactinospora veratri]|uniref:Uncharacterized protein n=1 Tax=Plantactinospora veratri TaxID=1436122 RepID=A0ABU7SMX2_9ACTN
MSSAFIELIFCSLMSPVLLDRLLLLDRRFVAVAVAPRPELFR